MNNKTILIVEDEKKIAALVADYLKNDGFSVDMLERGDMVVAYVKKNPPDLVLLDIMLPEMDGMSVCRELRKFSNVPIIMLTARVEEIDTLLGLELGADDYIPKPFSPREVVARVKAVLRRSRPEVPQDKLVAGPIVFEEHTRKVTVNGAPVRLTPNEFGLLKILMMHPGQVFSRNDLLNKVQGYSYDGYDRTIDSHIKNLRKKIAVHCPEKEIIVSVYGVGYKLKLS